MKIFALAAGIALALGGVASSVPASAQGWHGGDRRGSYDRGHDRGRRWDNRASRRHGNDRRWNNKGRRCWTESRHHRNVRVCR